MNRYAALEADRGRSFEEAQREADMMFAQYELSQLLASFAGVGELCVAVLDELLRHDDAEAGALWLAPQGGGPLSLLACTDPGGASAPVPRSETPLTSAPPQPGSRTPAADRTEPATAPPPVLESAAAAADWCRSAGWWGVPLEESRDTGARFEQSTVGYVALRMRAGVADPGQPRFLPRVRHELAVAFRAAQLRETLVRERSLLSAILDSATDSIVAVNGQRTVVRMNPAALSLLGLPADAVPGPCSDLLGCERQARGGSEGQSGTRRARLACGSRCPFEEVLAGGSPIVGREQVVVTRNGEEIPVVASYARMSGPDAGAVAVLHDLRGTRALEELRTSFVAAVSHDLRTPLALIRAYVDTLLGMDLDAVARRRAVEGIGKATERLTALVDEILDVAHLEGDRIALRREPTSLASIAARVAAEFGDAPGVTPIELRVPPDLPPADVDADRIAQVLGNLVSNAAKYSQSSGPITIRASRRDRELVMSVEDDGEGIDPSERDQVFERFYRGRRARGSTAPGSGLGLYVCRRLVEAHGGTIWLDDRARGTSISFTLPLAFPLRTRRPRPADLTEAT
ncbi:MAG: sensor histidine kinase [Candidatus Limnocylindrales bacterium]